VFFEGVSLHLHDLPSKSRAVQVSLDTTSRQARCGARPPSAPVDNNPAAKQDEIQDRHEEQTGARVLESESEQGRTVEEERQVGMHEEIQDPVAEDHQSKHAGRSFIASNEPGNPRGDKGPDDGHKKSM